MSETVHYKGTAKRVDLKGLTNEEFAQNFIKSEGKEVPNYCETAVEYLVDRWDEKFFFYLEKQILFEITRESVDLDEDIIKAEFNGDNLNYELKFYNGGASFRECLEEAFDKINLH